MRTTNAVGIMEVQSDNAQIHRGTTAASSVLTRECPHPDWESGRLLEHPCPSSGLDLEMRAPVRRKLDDLFVREAELDVLVEFVIAHKLGTEANTLRYGPQGIVTDFARDGKGERTIPPRMHTQICKGPGMSTSRSVSTSQSYW